MDKKILLLVGDKNYETLRFNFPEYYKDLGVNSGIYKLDTDLDGEDIRKGLENVVESKMISCPEVRKYINTLVYRESKNNNWVLLIIIFLVLIILSYMLSLIPPFNNSPYFIFPSLNDIGNNIPISL